MSWKKITEFRDYGVSLQHEGIKDFNDAAQRLDDEGRKKAQEKIKKGDAILAQAAQMAQRHHQRVSKKKK